MNTGAKTGRFQQGNDPRRGHGKAGRSGRRPFAITIAAQKAVTDNNLIAEVVKIAQNAEAKDNDRLAAIKFLVERGWGPATEGDEGSQPESHEAGLELLA